MRYNYRPKKKDPSSLSYLDTLTKNELLKKKKEFEGSIDEINKVFNQKDYDFFNKKKEKKYKFENSYESLKDEFNILKKQIIFKKRYFIWKGFFGGIKSATVVEYIVCDESNLTKSIIKKLKDLISFKKECDCSEYNYKLLDFALKSRIALQNQPQNEEMPDGFVVKYGFSVWDLLNTIPLSNDNSNTGITIDYDKRQITSGLKVYDKIFHPEKIFKGQWIEGWADDAIEVDKDFFSTAKSGLAMAFLIGGFFKKYKELGYGVSLYIFNVIEEDIFKSWRNDLLKHYEKYLRKTTLVLRSIERNKKLSKNLNSVYILSNKSYENTYKVGWTSMLPEERAEQLSSETGVLHPFKVVYKKKFKDAEKTEKKIHKNFNKYRVKRNKEYFEINLDELKDYIESI